MLGLRSNSIGFHQHLHWITVTNRDPDSKIQGCIVAIECKGKQLGYFGQNRMAGSDCVHWVEVGDLSSCQLAYELLQNL